MTVTVLLGYEKQTHWGPAKTIVVDEHPSEINPEDVYHACNRIEDCATDRAMMLEMGMDPFYGILRALLDTAKATSMMVGDIIWLQSDEGADLGGWRVDSFGFSELSRLSTTWRELTQGTELHIWFPKDRPPLTPPRSFDEVEAAGLDGTLRETP